MMMAAELRLCAFWCVCFFSPSRLQIDVRHHRGTSFNWPADLHGSECIVVGRSLSKHARRRVDRHHRWDKFQLACGPPWSECIVVGRTLSKHARQLAVDRQHLAEVPSSPVLISAKFARRYMIQYIHLYHLT